MLVTYLTPKTTLPARFSNNRAAIQSVGGVRRGMRQCTESGALTLDRYLSRADKRITQTLNAYACADVRSELLPTLHHAAGNWR